MDNNKKIILYPNAELDIDFKMTQRIGEILEKNGRRTAFCPWLSDDAADFASSPPPRYETAKLEDELPTAEMIVTIGGDGTILRAARAAADFGVPILGVNLGGKGFMAELETDDLGLLEDAAKGGYSIENRMMMDVEIQRDGEVICRDFALNDVVVRGDNKVIDLTLFGDGQRISHFSGDGAVIASPTGSTAYSMAAGGPIVEPAAHNIIVTPICAHMLEARSFVLVSDRRVSVEIGYKKHNPAYMATDGGDHVGVQSGDIIKVQKSEKSTRLVRLSNRSFYKKVSEKLGERE